MKTIIQIWGIRSEHKHFYTDKGFQYDENGPLVKKEIFLPFKLSIGDTVAPIGGGGFYDVSRVFLDLETSIITYSCDESK